MNIIDRANILAFHKARIRDFGAGTERALGWKSTASQTARFDVLAGIADLDGQSVLDVGCGHGDLRAYLAERCPSVRYTGIDQMQDFLDVALSRYGEWPDTRFLLGDFSSAKLPEVDYVLASGAMGYRSSDPEFVFETITRLFEVCRIGLGFNVLCHVEYPDGILAACDPEAVLAHCRTLTENVVYRDDYLEDDFTVLMYR